MPLNVISATLDLQHQQAISIVGGVLSVYRNNPETMLEMSTLRQELRKLEFELVHSAYYSNQRIIKGIAVVLSAGAQLTHLPQSRRQAIEDAAFVRFGDTSYRDAVNGLVAEECNWHGTGSAART